MKLGIVLSTKNTENNWNAFRLANFAISQDDEVNIFLIGQGVEYTKGNSEKFNIREQIEKFLSSPSKAKILACGTCLKVRDQKESKVCPISTLNDLYTLIKNSDKIISF